MYNRSAMSQRSAYRSRLFVLAVSAAMLVGLVNLHGVSAQSGASDWEKAAGGKMSFDVAAVRQDTNSDADPQSNVPLRSMDSISDSFSPTGGLFRASNFLLSQYIAFAYKLSPEEAKRVQLQLPKWANTSEYDIVARASGNPTKDQFRLMMQALLAERFKLLEHYETKEMAVWALTLDKPGNSGPACVSIRTMEFHVRRHRRAEKHRSEPRRAAFRCSAARSFTSPARHLASRVWERGRLLRRCLRMF